MVPSEAGEIVVRGAEITVNYIPPTTPESSRRQQAPGRLTVEIDGLKGYNGRHPVLGPADFSDIPQDDDRLMVGVRIGDPESTGTLIAGNMSCGGGCSQPYFLMHHPLPGALGAVVFVMIPLDDEESILAIRSAMIDANVSPFDEPIGLFAS